MIGRARWLVAVLALSALLPVAAPAATITGVVVTGDSNPNLAGRPNGATCCSGDSAPTHSPVEVLGLAYNSGDILTFSATGQVSNTGSATPGNIPDGSGIFNMTDYDGGIAPALGVNLNALVGVFLGPSEPSGTGPTSITFSGGVGLDFASLSPEVGQIFFIGDGLTGNLTGAIQEFEVPDGATRLFLGTSDGFGWFNNSGQFTVTINGPGDDQPPTGVPLPAGLVLVGLGLVVGLTRRALASA